MSHLAMGIVNKDYPVRWTLNKDLQALSADQIMAALYQLGREGKPAPAFERWNRRTAIFWSLARIRIRLSV